MAYHQTWQVGLTHLFPCRCRVCCNVDSVLAKLPAKQLHLSIPVHAVSSAGDGLILETATGAREEFDHIIFACHSDDALRILDAGSCTTPAGREGLGAFRWSRNEVWLHSDENVDLHFP
jgi:predicted NAD/FAD-binding protein